MFLERILLLGFTLAIVPAAAQRSQADVKVRGSSFGLENYLYQSLEESDVTNAVRDVKRGRPTVSGLQSNYPKAGDQALEIQNLHVAGYVTNRPTEQRKSQTSSLTRDATKDPAIVTPERFEVSHEFPTERGRTRVVMRRRKRPHGAGQPEKTGEFHEDRVPNAGKVKHQGSRVGTSPTAQLTNKPTEQSKVNAKNHFASPTVYQPDLQSRKQFNDLSKAPVEPNILTTEKSSTINLKTFLKQQTETLSLSELLQTQNLSLADLLKGNKDASAILKAKQTIFSVPPSKNDYQRNSYPRVPPSTTTTEPHERIYENSKSGNEFSGLRPIPSSIPTGNGVGNQFGNKRDDSIPKIKETYEDSVKTTKRPSTYNLNPLSVEYQNRINDLRAKLRNYQRRTQNQANEPEISDVVVGKAKIEGSTTPTIVGKVTDVPLYKKKRIPFKSSNNPELSLIVPDRGIEGTEKRQPDRIIPDRLPPPVSPESNRFEDVKSNDHIALESSPRLTTVTPVQETTEKKFEMEFGTSTTQGYDDSAAANRKPELKDELIELLRSQQNADALQKILRARNMTLQEILDNREKSTVQSNIEELFSNHQRARVFTTETTASVKVGQNYRVPDFDQFKATTGELFAAESSPVTETVTLFASRGPKQYHSMPSLSTHEASILSFKPDDLTADTANSENQALWKLSEKSIIYGSTYGHPVSRTTKHHGDRPRYRTTPAQEDDIILLETLENSRETNRKFKLDSHGFVKEDAPLTEDIEKSYIPPAVKSAIIASGVVMGIALFIFIAIFAACGWRQRRIRLKGSPSIIGDKPKKKIVEKSKRGNMSDSKSYKKTLDFDDDDDDDEDDDENSDSGTSFAGSYLWSTLKNTFTSRTSTIKSQLEKEEKLRQSKTTLSKNESKKKVKNRLEERPNIFQTHEERLGGLKKIDRGRNVINTSFSFKRAPGKDNIDYFNECNHRY